MRSAWRLLLAAALLLPAGCGPDREPSGQKPAGTSPEAQAAAKKSQREFEDAIVSLIDELSVKDPLLLGRIRDEQRRIKALPTREAQKAAVNGAYPILERALERSAARGRLSPEGAAKWKAFSGQVRKAISDGTLLDRALFAGKAFEDTVQALLSSGTVMLDPDRKLPEDKEAYMDLSQRIHAELGVPRNSTTLSHPQVDKAFELAGAALGIRPEFLKYMAKTESGLRQVVPSNPAAAGIMQVEKVHKGAFVGAWNAANDTITNIVYGALLRALVNRELARQFEDAGIPPPSSARIVEFLGDLAYNRGPALLKHVARHAAEQGIDVNNFGEYLGGPGGDFSLLDGGERIVVIPGPGTKIDKTGRNSVLALASRDVGRVLFSEKLAAGLGDRNGDGRVDHLDVWLTRGVHYLADASLSFSGRGGVVIDPALVTPLSQARKGLIREYPYVAHFKKDWLDLYYVASDHENDVRSRTLTLIKRIFDRYDVRRVIVEGRPYEQGEVPRESVRRIEKESRSGRFKWGETDYAILLASKKGVRAVGGEPSDREVLRSVRQAGFETKDLLGLYFVRMMPTYRAQGRLAKEFLPALYAETMKWARKDLAPGDETPFGYEDFLAWHRKKLGADFDASKVDHETFRADSKGTFLQKVADQVNIVRNRALAIAITKELNARKSVLVVYGNGHHAAQRPALEAAMGKPVYEGTLGGEARP